MFYTRWVAPDSEDLRRALGDKVSRILQLEPNAAHCLVVYADDIPAAGGILVLDNARFCIEQVSVLPGFRGQRYGDLVVRMLIRRAFDSGARSVYVEAPADVRGFFGKLGFTPAAGSSGSGSAVTMVRTSDVSGCCGDQHG